MGEEKPVVVAKDEQPSDRDPSRTYRVTVFSDGTATCACADYVLRGINVGNLNHRCKHIRRALARAAIQQALAAGQQERTGGTVKPRPSLADELPTGRRARNVEL
jgi:hypothetical protein